MRYYFSKLNSKDREIYKQLYYGMEGFEDKIAVKGDKDIVSEIYNMILKDNPMIFYIDPSSRVYTQIGDYTWIEPVYVYDKKEVEEIKLKLNSILKPLEKKLKTINTNLDKERFIHRYLISNVKYKYNHLENDFECHTIVGSLIHKNAVCDGISKAFKQLCDLARINCNVVYGDGWNEYEKPQKHAWNMVKIEGNWYHIDETWNINLSERFKYVRYDYFNLREIDITKDHINFGKLEVCNSLENNYFYENKCILNGENELDKFLVDRLNDIKMNNASKNIYFKLNCNNDDVNNLIVSSINKAFLKTNYFTTRYMIDSNDTQNVYLIRLN
ncbi:transglutaminase domain-containing protein [Intestinibacter sp.]